MAGTKGRSGGARPGAGRKPKPKPIPVPIDAADMLEMLLQVAFGQVDVTPLQVRAAIAAIQYTHVKKHDGGKKDDPLAKAKKAATGKFAAATPPLKLVP